VDSSDKFENTFGRLIAKGRIEVFQGNARLVFYLPEHYGEREREP